MAQKELREGMWVLYQGKIAIMVKRKRATSEEDPEILVDGAEIHLVHPLDGMTILEIPFIAQSSLAQASYEDIPACRRPTPARGGALGYL